MRIASLDLGSNTFLCLVAEVEADAKGFPYIREILSDEVRMVRLGQGVAQNRRFHPEALERARSAFMDFRQTLDRLQPEVILAMATSAARDVTNQQELFQLGDEFHIPIEIIPGHQEAEITYQGAMSGTQMGVSAGSTLVVDIGGGSTEFILGGAGLEQSQIQWAKSLDLGCVRLKERVNPGDRFTPEDLQKARQLIRHELTALSGDQKEIEQILAVAGTPTELARLEIGHFDPKLIDGYRLSKERIENWIERLAVLSATEIHEQYEVSRGRADVLVLGLLILSEALSYFRRDELRVSTRGVRFGVALVAWRRARSEES